MGKKRARKEDGEETTPKKKHKKSKHKKHAKSQEEEEEETVVVAEPPKPGPGVRPFTLKIKLGDQLISSSSSTNLCETPGDDSSSITGSVQAESSVGVADDASDILGQDVESDEEAWLEALETGQVNSRGYLPERSDSANLTARQRAMLGADPLEDKQELMELPLLSEHRAAAAAAQEELTEEMLLRKSEKNMKRRLQAQKRKEKRKAETVRKLLEKQSKKKEEDKPKPAPKAVLPHVRYVSSLVGGASLSLPVGMEFPLKPQKGPLPPPPVERCSVEGCPNAKRYSDSLTRRPLCSLLCYKKLRGLTLP